VAKTALESTYYRITLSPTNHPCLSIVLESITQLTFTRPYSPYSLASLTYKAAGLQGRI
jgi:hypothetical protein